MDEKKFQELMENEEFVEELLSKEEPEDAQKLFADNGVTMSIDEIKWLGSLLAKSIEGDVDPEKILSFAKGEITKEDLKEDLGDEELQEVSGGGFITVTAGTYAFVETCVTAGGPEMAGAAAAAASTGVGIPVAIGIAAAGTIAAGVITVTRSWGKVGRGVTSAARSVGRAARSVGRALTSRW